MSKRLDFLWIDDDKSREVTATNLEKNAGVKVYFYNFAGEDLAGRIGHLLQEHSPDMVIVDHNLDRTIGPLRDNLTSTGASVAEVIKDSHPQIPVVCVTKFDPIRDMTFMQQSAYDEIFSATHLTHQNPVLVAIAEGFRNIHCRPIKDEDEFLSSLGCPEVDLTRLVQVLPTEIKTGFGDRGYASVLWRWMRGVLFARPGFLYDSMWAATLVGVTNNSFLKTREMMEPAIYSGPFANEIEPRWWPSKMLEVLYKNSPDREQKDPRLLGRAYLGIPIQGYSKCEISGIELPDTVAFTDTTDKKRAQVCLRFTEEHPGFQKLLFFEEMRVIKDAL